MIYAKCSSIFGEYWRRSAWSDLVNKYLSALRLNSGNLGWKFGKILPIKIGSHLISSLFVYSIEWIFLHVIIDAIWDTHNKINIIIFCLTWTALIFYLIFLTSILLFILPKLGLYELILFFHFYSMLIWIKLSRFCNFIILIFVLFPFAFIFVIPISFACFSVSLWRLATMNWF